MAENLVDRVWDGQPAYPENEVFPLDVKFSGESWQSKVKSLRSVMSERGVRYKNLSFIFNQHSLIWICKAVASYILEYGFANYYIAIRLVQHPIYVISVASFYLLLMKSPGYITYGGLTLNSIRCFSHTPPSPLTMHIFSYPISRYVFKQISKRIRHFLGFHRLCKAVDWFSFATGISRRSEPSWKRPHTPLLRH